MRVFSLVLLVVVVALANGANLKPIIYNLDDAPQLFEQFIKDNDKHYKDAADRKLHYDAFVDNLKYINDHNSKNKDYTLGITLFADQTEQERKNQHGGLLYDNI